MGTVTLRSVVLGAGAPKLAAPITGAAREEIAAEGAALAAADVADVAEWRADFFERACEEAELLDALAALRAALGETPLLFTLRTRRQGGAREIDPMRYYALCAAAARSGNADAVDVECITETARDLVDAVHAAGLPVVGSVHDFGGTPPRDAMLSRLRAIRDTGADVLKLAVMPHSRADVLALLEATETAARVLDRPVVTVSMSPLGAVSRVCGGAFGSAMTFGAAGRASAPGQLPARQLREALALLYGRT